ncbi:von Willebrand factor A domain-containing protein 8 [Maniola hyperantus]|uniref:von Willebrand factor A domain-containing protein 8 n=1 Tax=Aphantopus hyperantus TaxID=2795564 RepID=UPI0015686CC2|nr:von Willebrand factor A domain-containing protein 8 [Maniola hyperantus]XP_034832346.1 von Willebrand factor A domain-containing protein 8 [Maniola hyperantus]
MYNPAITVKRIDVLIRILNGRKTIINSNFVRAYSSEGKITIGNVCKDIKSPKKVEYVPKKYLITEDSQLKSLSQSTLRNLRWMMQKDILGQDMFLLGRPGPSRRKVALQYLELTQREIEYVALSRDTTEADLKQRREIQSSTAKYFDQSAVRAAIEGRVLVLEGIEKAERNVLPVLNNLLENREMHLEDGRFLIPASRYDKLLEEHGPEEVSRWRLVRVDENFRVIALGLPVPKYTGQPLDPPLRSRFQARDVATVGFGEHLNSLKDDAPQVDTKKLEQVLSAAYALISPELQQISLPDFPVDNLYAAALILERNPDIPIHKLLYILYPYNIFLSREHIKNVEAILHNLKINTEPKWNIALKGVEFTGKQALVNIEINGKASQFAVACGERKSKSEKKGFVKTEYQTQLLNELMLSHSVGDFCVVGPKGCGKSLLISQLASLLGYTIEPIVLYQDMTARDLIQQRTTLDNGDTVWRNSALVEAALKGHLAVLDGLHRIHASTLAVLHRLVHDRELQLHDGTRLLRYDRYDDLLASGLTQQELEESNVKRIHPAFRIVALAEPPVIGTGQQWLSPEILSLFLFHEMRNLSKTEEMFIINSLYGDISDPLHSIIDLADQLRNSEDNTLKNLSSSLSTRQLLRIASRMSKYPIDSPYETVQRTFLAKFLPNLARRALDSASQKIGIDPPTRSGIFNRDPKKVKCTVKNGVLTIGNTSTEIFKTDALTKVPDILFYDVPQHMRLLEWLLQDFLLGNHLLLVGNQGVGKNKIADRLLQLLNRPREYIQLHRDTTVQSLTVQPTVRDGIVIYEDSPLVKAVKYGHVLVVDEADKAPTHVTCILKTLVENGEMILSDGRRIVPKDMIESSGGDVSSFIPVHEDFRMIVLANRPGFPFLGNDFFASLGDLFSCHAVDNPSIDSELELLRSYGPDVPQDIMKKLVHAFALLRNMADQGQLTYPYSTRELVNIVKHLQKYPEEDLASAIGNVFDFDRYSKDMADTLLEVLHSSGLPTEGVLDGRSKEALKKIQMTIERTSGKDVSSPKHGKEDPDNQPHVGGNTWAGGTGGRDTAGLGGKGGPYRLDKGHDVHQLSDAEKDDVPEHVKRAAREMNRKAFEERLKEIRMSEYDAKLYGQFLRAVQPQIGALRGVLAELQAKKKERQWSRHQTSGELDDGKIIEGLTGERSIYRRRTEQEPPPGSPPDKPKRLRLVLDVSGSMYRFNSYDGRLERSMEAVVLLTEALKGYEARIRYDMYAHSGEEHALELVRVDRPPENEKERLQIIRTMQAHAQFCWSGDNTLPATKHAISTLAKEDADEAIVLILSDANLRRYGIPPEHLGTILTSDPRVQAHVIFIGSLGDEANSLLRKLPVGHAHVCMDVASLPQIMQQIFASSLLQNS